MIFNIDSLKVKDNDFHDIDVEYDYLNGISHMYALQSMLGLSAVQPACSKDRGGGLSTASR